MTRERRFNAPSWRNTALEVGSVVEMGAHVVSTRWLNRLPKGDGHPVIVYPGFMASDLSTAPLRRVLRKLGYQVHAWNRGRNIGPTSAVRAGIVNQVLEVNRRSGRRASLIGWSLGGLYAHRLAVLHPDVVRQVITLASPVRMMRTDQSRATPLFEALESFHDPNVDRDRHFARPDVPSTSLYTKTDGIVNWESCLLDDEPHAENIEVLATHIGIGHNPAVLAVIADRLAQKGEWQPYVPTSSTSRFVRSAAEF